MSAATKTAFLAGAEAASFYNQLVLHRVMRMYDEWLERVAACIAPSPDAYRMLDELPIATWFDDKRVARFPPPTGLDVNMMPFDPWDISTLPLELHGYQDMIWTCVRDSQNNELYESNGLGRGGFVCYLTVHESEVPDGRSQRKAGVHIDRPAAAAYGGRVVHSGSEEYKHFSFGRGHVVDDVLLADGIYIASNVEASCRVWPVLVSGTVTDAHGGLEKLKGLLGRGRVLPANRICWITDSTPHESLPVRGPTYRQFFRLVVGPVSVWYSKHNTPNPLGVQPDAIISDDDKFALFDAAPAFVPGTRDVLRLLSATDPLAGDVEGQFVIPESWRGRASAADGGLLTNFFEALDKDTPHWSDRDRLLELAESLDREDPEEFGALAQWMRDWVEEDDAVHYECIIMHVFRGEPPAPTASERQPEAKLQPGPENWAYDCLDDGFEDA